MFDPCGFGLFVEKWGGIQATYIYIYIQYKITKDYINPICFWMPYLWQWYHKLSCSLWFQESTQYKTEYLDMVVNPTWRLFNTFSRPFRIDPTSLFCPRILGFLDGGVGKTTAPPTSESFAWSLPGFVSDCFLFSHKIYQNINIIILDLQTSGKKVLNLPFVALFSTNEHYFDSPAVLFKRANSRVCRAFFQSRTPSAQSRTWAHNTANERTFEHSLFLFFAAFVTRALSS